MQTHPKISAVFGVHEEKTLEQLRDVAVHAEKVALMADGHLGYVMPIGGVAAYKNRVSVVGVGFDIACGNCAIKTDLLAETFERRDLTRFADEIAAEISFGVGRKNRSDDAPVDHPLFEDPAWEGVPAHHRGNLKQKARAQLGTVGSGNHYVDVLVDDDGFLWVGVHFGSRGFGHTVASGFLAIGAGEAWGTRVPETEVLFDLDSPAGDAYYHLMELAGRYAYAGREWVARKTVSILGGTETDRVHNHHNFAWRETHDGEERIVVRKGATPAFPGQRGFVGGSMGDDSVILAGRTSDDPAVRALQEDSLYSTVHGAGRVMSRTQAAGKRNRKTGELIRPGLVTPQMMAQWLDEKGVILRGGGLDESPHAYRRLPDVLAAQGATIQVETTLRPLVVAMAGADEFDPYKD
ncbi:MAG TPA: RtcB family protein [Thermoanaerobaculia bacterium]|jgi:tRNA-splicing ligase RtcB|nr:RtcB family protein [Thermoanaerobaculia bacterium]